MCVPIRIETFPEGYRGCFPMRRVETAAKGRVAASEQGEPLIALMPAEPAA